HQIPMVELERLLQDFRRKWERIHSCSRRSGVTGIFQPLHHLFGPADAQMCGGDYFERRSPTMKCKLETAARNFWQHAARRWVAALTNDVHLHEVDAG